MSNSLASIKDRLQESRERGEIDWLCILDALETLTDAVLAIQLHVSPVPGSVTEEES